MKNTTTISISMNRKTEEAFNRIITKLENAGLRLSKSAVFEHVVLHYLRDAKGPDGVGDKK